jgi:hypothetical protein
MESLLQTPLMEVGHMNHDHWRRIAEAYAKMGMIKPDFDLNKFLYKHYPPQPNLKWFYIGLAAALALMFVASVKSCRCRVCALPKRW